MLSIQELVKATGVTSRMLRYYDEKGILSPRMRSESGVRYYDEAAIGRISLIGTFLSLGYSVETIREMLSEDTFSPANVMEIVREQKVSLIRQKEKIEESLRILDEIDEEAVTKMTSWKEVEETIHRLMSETKVKEAHKDLRTLLQNSWRRQGSDFDEWMRFMFEPVVFPKAEMKMAEVNASNGYYWIHNEDRLPKGELDLFYDPDIRKGNEHPKTPGLKTVWRAMTDLDSAMDKTYDLVFNDHPQFYREQVKEGIEEMHRILKKGGSLYLICEDADHNQPFAEWKNTVQPSRIYRRRYYREHYVSDILIPLIREIFGNVTDYPRRNAVHITDMEEIRRTFESECKLEDSDYAARQRLENVMNEVGAEMKKQGSVERVSYYHILKAVKE